MQKRDKEEPVNYDILKLENRMLKRKTKLLEKELEKWKDTERIPINVDKELKIFIVGMVHSLRNELILMQTTAHQIKQNQKASDIDFNKDLEAIERSVKLSEILLGNLMDYVGFGEILYKPVIVNRLLNNLIPLLLPRLPQDVELETDMNISDNLKVMANADQLRQILINLVNNAVWAMRDREKGLLKIVCREVTEGKDYLQIEIIDNGIGIPHENMQKIFEMDFSTKRKGWGMGLYLTRLIVNKYGGTIFINSEPGKRTTVTINIPVYSVKEEINEK